MANTHEEILTTADFEELVWRGKREVEELSPIEQAVKDKDMDMRARLQWLQREGYQDAGSFTV